MRALKIYPFILIFLLAGNPIHAITNTGTGSGTPREQYVLFSGMKTNYSIVLSTEASESESYQARGGEFQALKSWLIAKLLWNPDINTNEVINDFMNGYYGRSGQYVRQYFDVMQSLVKPHTHIDCYAKIDDPVFSDQFIRESVGIFKKARKVADNEAIARRVDIATLPVLYLKCKRSPVVAKNEGTFDQFLEICKKEGIVRLSEGGENIDTFKKYVLKAKREM